MDILNIENFMPHGHCYMWRKDILILNVSSDIIISLCYFVIPLILFLILLKRKDLPFRSTITIFAVFIFFCSLTHIMEIINVWYPYYYLTGIIKTFTAIVSIFSTIIILINLNKILALPNLKNIENKFFDEMHLIMKKIPIGIIFSDSRGRINYYNEYISNLFKYNSNELNNKSVEVLIEESLRDGHKLLKNSYFINPTDKSMGEGRVLTGKTKDGDIKYLEIGLRPITLQTQQQNLLIVAIKDITAEEKNRRKLHETLKLINVATYGMPSLLAYINKNGKYEFVNKAYTKSWNLPEEELLNKHYKDFLPADIKELLEEKMEIALTGKELNFQTSVYFPFAGKKNLDVFYIPHLSADESSIEGVVVLAHDITEINKTLKKVQISNAQLEEYAFLVSHDLRAPVRHIANFIELLEKQLGSESPKPERIEKYMKVIKENSNKAQQMITGMLKIASINQIVPIYENLELKPFFEKLSDIYKVKAKVSVTYEDALTINTDTDLIDSIFTNLISNSINFSKNNIANIFIGVRKTSTYLEVQYHDDGHGIDPKIIQHIFNPFVKSEGSKGLGLGMTIIKRSLEKLNGSIECLESTSGAKFLIRIKTKS